MSFLIKALLVLVVLGIAIQQGITYYDVVILGDYFSNAAFGGAFMTGIVWPIAVVVIAIGAIILIIKVKPSNLRL